MKKKRSASNEWATKKKNTRTKAIKNATGQRKDVIQNGGRRVFPRYSAFNQPSSETRAATSSE